MRRDTLINVVSSAIQQVASDPAARTRNGTRFAASYHRWANKLNAPPPVLPRAWAPLALNELPEHLGPRTGNTLQTESRDHFRARRNVVATLGDVRGARHVRKALVSQPEIQAFKQQTKYENTCLYCHVSESLDAASPHTTSEPEVITHPDIVPSFDPHTFITAAEVPKFEVKLTTDQMLKLFYRIDPRHWKETAPDFFDLSQPGYWRNSNWHPDDDEDKWNRQGGGQIYEIAVSQMNLTTGIQAHNIINISGFRPVPSAEQLARRQPFTFGYNYDLDQTIGSKFGFVWEFDGLDVDGGYYWADVTSVGPDTWLANIRIRKALRYTPLRSAPQQFGSLMNLMAPALLNMFMRELVFDALKDLQ